MDHKVLQLDVSFNETKIFDQLPMHRLWEMNLHKLNPPKKSNCALKAFTVNFKFQTKIA